MIQIPFPTRHVQFCPSASPYSFCVKVEETQGAAGARCCCVRILGVTEHTQRTKTVLRKQAWSSEHRIHLQTGQCCGQILPIFTQQTLCSVSPHSQLCPVCLFFYISHSLYLLLFFLFQAGKLALESVTRVQIRGPDSRCCKNRSAHLRLFPNQQHTKRHKESRWNPNRHINKH